MSELNVEDGVIAVVFRKIREAGIGQSRTHQWEDETGAEWDGDVSTFAGVKRVCTFGALYYAEYMGWIDTSITPSLVKRLKQIALEQFGCKFVGRVERDDMDWTFSYLEKLGEPTCDGGDWYLTDERYRILS